MRPRRLRYYCETHDAWLATSDHALHNTLAGCVLTVWESVLQASPARPNVGGNLSSEGGHVQSPMKLVPAIPTEKAQFQVRMVEEGGDVYVSAHDVIDYLRLVDGGTTQASPAGVARDILDAIEEFGR